MNLVISSGHGKLVRGASGYIDEVDEARKVVDRVTEILEDHGHNVHVFHDDTSTSQNQNLNRIVDFHNNKTRDLDVSVHFNSYQTTSSPMGTECLYVTQDTLAAEVTRRISESSNLKNRGPKKRTNLFFLNNTEKPAILVETCFVDSSVDVDLYRTHFEGICAAICSAVSGEDIEDSTPLPPELKTFHVTGRASYFGGPTDNGVSPTEGLAFITHIEQAPQLFLPFQPKGTTGLARRLNPYVHYVACRWDYSKTPKPSLLNIPALVRALDTNIALKAFPADWGPNESTGRVADLSPSLMEDLGIKTDDQVEVSFPYDS